ncbi:hypothetical protein E3T27_15500 [Cryobacterium lyxosi]|uniref:Uncharacterized protein n=2 Tax=Cryobacterium lyxosi TaxID=1259228 RepID=A0A4R8Z8P3_9MICO|nr:hypothetical protein E3T27_15500 [Cryobacterium lyxosi]
MSRTRRTVPRIIASLGLGLVVGALTYYVTAVVAAVQVSGNFTNNSLTLAIVAIVGALAVAVGWRWPIVGLTAGIVIIAVVVWAVTGRMGWSPSNGALNPYNAVAFGALSVAPTLVGAMIVTASALRLRSRRTR